MPASPGDFAAGSAPCPAPPPRQPDPVAAPAGSLTLQTTLFGPLTVPDGAARAAELEELSRRAAVYATRARGDGTRRAYRSAWRSTRPGAAASAANRSPPIPTPSPCTSSAAPIRASPSARSACISPRSAPPICSPAARSTCATRASPWWSRASPASKGVRPRRQAAPAVPGVLRLMLAAPPRPRHARSAPRDRAMLLLGFGAALRRSELVALTLGDVETVPGRGLALLVRRSKTDQHGQGQDIAVWANPAEPGVCPPPRSTPGSRIAAPPRISTGPPPPRSRAERPLFCAVTKAGRVTGTALSDKAVARLVKQAARDAGLDPERYSGHSLRAGLATAAGDAGAGLAELMRQTRHKSTEVALGYLRPADLWRNNVTEKVFSGDKKS